jgi:hypothetical protein
MIVDAERSARPAEESWTEQRLRERLAEVRAGEARRPRPYEREEPEAAAWADEAWGRTDRPALSATGPEPASAWTQSWRREEPTSANPRPRRPDFDLSDDRWR